MKTSAAALASIALAFAGEAFAEDASIRNGATLDAYLAQQRAEGLERVGWVNPFLPQASASHGDAVATAGEGVSGDALLGRIVAGLDRAALDRGGWNNPYVRNAETYEAGHPLLLATPGQGVTTGGPTQAEVRPTVASR
ncbi:MAG TPA: hypothetical protein VFK90_08330 [Anaeromyxobacter sp.]|nr:hypothetical protein [Anaeromyxobacter sp.]